MHSEVTVLQRWNIASFVLHFLSAIAQAIVVGLYSDRLFRVPIQIQIGASMSVLGCVPVSYVLLAFAPLTAVFHLLAAQEEQIRSVLKHDRDGLRWFEYSITAGDMTVAIAMLSGVWDLNTLLVLFLLNIVVQALGYEFEVVWPLKPSSAWRIFGWSSLTFLASWYFIFYAFFNAIVSFNGDLPWFLYTVIFALFGLNLMFPLLVGMHRVAWQPLLRCFGVDFRKPLHYAVAFMALSFVAKFVLNWFVLLGGLNARVPLADQLCPLPQ